MHLITGDNPLHNSFWCADIWPSWFSGTNKIMEAFGCLQHEFAFRKAQIWGRIIYSPRTWQNLSPKLSIHLTVDVSPIHSHFPMTSLDVALQFGRFAPTCCFSRWIKSHLAQMRVRDSNLYSHVIFCCFIILRKSEFPMQSHDYQDTFTSISMDPLLLSIARTLY